MRQFNRLFSRFIVRHLLQERLRSTATILGIALGILALGFMLLYRSNDEQRGRR